MSPENITVTSQFLRVIKLTDVMVDSLLHPVVLIVRVDREVGQADGEVLHWAQAVGAAGGETVGPGYVPVTQSYQVDGGGGGLNYTYMSGNRAKLGHSYWSRCWALIGCC